MAGNPFSNFISGIGSAVGAPVLFDWDTDAARADAAAGSDKRGVDSQAYAEVNRNKEYARANGNIVNYAGEVIGTYDQGNGGGATPAADTGATAGSGYAPDYAAIAAAQKRDAARRNIQATQAGYRDSAAQGVTDTANKYQNDVQKFLGTIENGQTGINTGRTNNALNLRRSMSNIAGGIRTGLKSGGVQLANMNATDSGAADAMARAYATMGNQQVGDATNESLLKENELQGQQTILNRNKDEGVASFDREREAEKARIAGDLRTKLSLLDATGQADGVSNVVDMGIVDAIVNDAVARLSAVDNQRNQRLQGVRSLSEDDVNRKAAEMDALGKEGTSPFTAGTEGISLVGQDSQPGASISQLPFYTRKTTDDQPLAIPLSEKDKQQTF